jgi:IMP cyclohydrolase
MKLTQALKALEYPGRLLAAGADPSGAGQVVYVITGRSASSQARKLVRSGDKVMVRPTDEETLKKGNPDLLIYSAVMAGECGVAVSNGKQTEDIFEAMRSEPCPAAALARALAGWDYEPDSPIFTPRISACVSRGRLALCVVRRGPGGESLRDYFERPFARGRAYVVSTYRGENSDPLSVFDLAPVEVETEESDPNGAAEQVYDSLAPRTPGRDFRVAVACVSFDPDNPAAAAVSIINRIERR